MRVVLLGLCAAACGDNVVDKTAACRLGTAASASTIEDRYVIGEAAPYAPDLALAARDGELEQSIAARRQAAWQIVERVLAPVPFSEPALVQRFGVDASLPAWHSWYAKDDFERVFKTLYRDLGPEGRAARAPLDVTAGFAANAVALDDDPAWSPQRYDDHVAGIDTLDKLAGIGGASRVGYSPGAMGHLIQSYAKQDACRTAADPDRFAFDPVREPHAVTQREALEVGECELRIVGPVQAGRGDVVVTTTGEGDLDLYVRRGAPPTTENFDCRSDGDAADEACSLAGEGPIYIALFGATAGRADLEIAYVTEDVRDPACLDGELPRDAVVIKADWRRQFTGEVLPTYDTSASAMANHLRGDAVWSAGGEADPSPAEIYTIELPAGLRFR
nr:PPC domain-containing protein [Deltaproteobacteria bacterium]